MKDLDFNNGTISILKGVISGFLIAYLIVLGLRPAAEYPDNLLEIIDNPWIFVVLVLINFYVMQWDTTIGLLMLLSIIALILDIFIFTGGEIFSNDVETFKSDDKDDVGSEIDEDENNEEDEVAKEAAKEVDEEAPKDAKVAKEVDEEAPKDAKVAREVDKEASKDAKVAREVDEEAPKDAKVAREVDEEAPEDAKVASKDVKKANKKPKPKEDSRYEDKPYKMSNKASDKNKLIKDIQEKFNSLVNILS